MDRLEAVRVIVDQMLSKLSQEEERKFAYLHLYGTSQFASMLCISHQIHPELPTIAAMLHDISMYALNSDRNHHALKSSMEAKRIMHRMKIFTDEEIQVVAHAIEKHSNKSTKHDSVCAEILKDADVLTHYFYNVNIPVSDDDKVRLYYLLECLKQHPIK